MAQEMTVLPENKGKSIPLDSVGMKGENNRLMDNDSALVSSPSKRKRRDADFSPNPMRATMLATALPGLGQIYNRKYWKVPIAYAGFAGVAFSIFYFSDHYNTYMKAYQDFTDDIPETDSYTKLISADPATYDPVLHPDTYESSYATWYQERMLRGLDYFKKYRDLSYLGIAAWYLFTILDAHVDACLFNYDVSDKIDITIAPLQTPNIKYAGMGVNVSFKLTF